MNLSSAQLEVLPPVFAKTKAKLFWPVSTNKRVQVQTDQLVCEAFVAAAQATAARAAPASGVQGDNPREPCNNPFGRSSERGDSGLVLEP